MRIPAEIQNRLDDISADHTWENIAWVCLTGLDTVNEDGSGFYTETERPKFRKLFSTWRQRALVQIATQQK